MSGGAPPSGILELSSRASPAPDEARPSPERLPRARPPTGPREAAASSSGETGPSGPVSPEDAAAAAKRKLELQRRAEKWRKRTHEVEVAIESNRVKRGDADDLTNKAYLLLDWMAGVLTEERLRNEKIEKEVEREMQMEDDIYRTGGGGPEGKVPLLTEEARRERIRERLRQEEFFGDARRGGFSVGLEEGEG